jgi:hypothetical protein
LRRFAATPKAPWGRAGGRPVPVLTGALRPGRRQREHYALPEETKTI